MSSRINPTRGTQEFFRDRIHQALENQHLQVEPDTEFYLVHLLERFATNETFHGGAQTPREEPVALMLKRAMEADTIERQIILRRMGDFCLYLSGFFPESLKRKLVDVDYYIRMGGTAYGTLAGALSPVEAFHHIFSDLGEHFTSYVDVFSEISEATLSRSETDLLRLYETWLRTGSERLAGLLREQGLIPLPNLNTKLH